MKKRRRSLILKNSTSKSICKCELVFLGYSWFSSPILLYAYVGIFVVLLWKNILQMYLKMLYCHVLRFENTASHVTVREWAHSYETLVLSETNYTFLYYYRCQWRTSYWHIWLLHNNKAPEVRCWSIVLK